MSGSISADDLRRSRNTNPQDWADAFIGKFQPNPSSMTRADLTMWFDDAINCGHHKETDDLTRMMASHRYDLRSLRKYITSHIAQQDKLPCRAEEMTERERAIFDILAADRGLLLFLRGHLKNLTNHLVFLDEPTTEE